MHEPEMNPLQGDHCPAPEEQFYSVGFLCQMLQTPPPAIAELMTLVGAKYAYSVNGVGYVKGTDVVKMSHAAREVREEIETKSKSYVNN